MGICFAIAASITLYTNGFDRLSTWSSSRATTARSRSISTRDHAASSQTVDDSASRSRRATGSKIESSNARAARPDSIPWRRPSRPKLRTYSSPSDTAILSDSRQSTAPMFPVGTRRLLAHLGIGVPHQRGQGRSRLGRAVRFEQVQDDAQGRPVKNAFAVGPLVKPRIAECADKCRHGCRTKSAEGFDVIFLGPSVEQIRDQTRNRLRVGRVCSPFVARARGRFHPLPVARVLHKVPEPAIAALSPGCHQITIQQSRTVAPEKREGGDI